MKAAFLICSSGKRTLSVGIRLELIIFFTPGFFSQRLTFLNIMIIPNPTIAFANKA